MTKCTSYSTAIENDFYTELFSTDFRDYDSSTQNAKTDLLSDDPSMSFEDWLDQLINSYAEEAELDSRIVHDALSDKFIKDLKFEYDDLKELMSADED